MQYMKLDTCGLTVSRPTFGAVTSGTGDFHGFRHTVGQDLADQMVGVALDAGVTAFDTADVHAAGHSERMLGEGSAPQRTPGPGGAGDQGRQPDEQ